MRKLTANFARFLAKHRNKNWINKIYYHLDTFLRKSNNVNFNSKTNGEDRVLNILKRIEPAVIFDVGANVGDVSQLAHALYPNAEIHAFELVPKTFTELVKNTQHLSKIRPNNFGLSDESASVKMNVGAASVVATAFKIEGMKDHDDYYKEIIDCEVKKGADYLVENSIASIDFLKIDTEGNDFRVIKGFQEKLKDIKIIQFEYGIFNIQSKDLLKDFYTYLGNNGFLVGKIFPNHIDFSPYHFTMENFHGGNFLAINQQYEDIIKLFK